MDLAPLDRSLEDIEKESGAIFSDGPHHHVLEEEHQGEIFFEKDGELPVGMPDVSNDKLLEFNAQTNEGSTYSGVNAEVPGPRYSVSSTEHSPSLVGADLHAVNVEKSMQDHNDDEQPAKGYDTLNNQASDQNAIFCSELEEKSDLNPMNEQKKHLQSNTDSASDTQDSPIQLDVHENDSVLHDDQVHNIGNHFDGNKMVSLVSVEKEDHGMSPEGSVSKSDCLPEGTEAKQVSFETVEIKVDNHTDLDGEKDKIINATHGLELQYNVEPQNVPILREETYSFTERLPRAGDTLSPYRSLPADMSPGTRPSEKQEPASYGHGDEKASQHQSPSGKRRLQSDVRENAKRKRAYSCESLSPSEKQRSPSTRGRHHRSPHADSSRREQSFSPHKRESLHRRGRSTSQSPSRRTSNSRKRVSHDRSRRSRSPRSRDCSRRSPRRRHSSRHRSRSPDYNSRHRSPRRPWSPPANRKTGIGRPGRNLFVAGFSYGTTERDLEMKFARFGRVTDVRVVRDRRSGDSRGFGFLSLERDEDADAAILALDETEWNGRIILVEKSKTSTR